MRKDFGKVRRTSDAGGIRAVGAIGPAADLEAGFAVHLRNLTTVIANPRLGLQYLGWALRNATGGNPTFPLVNGARIGNFVNFSEYHSMLDCIALSEQHYLIDAVARSPGDIVDIGANIGIVSVLLAHAFPDRVVHAVEPVPTTFAALERNVGLNALSNVRAHRLAMADAPGAISFTAHPLRRATARIATTSDGDVQIVEATTLDAFVERNAIETLALLKIDVEGFETSVFAGARDTLSRRLAKVIFMEICPPLTASAGFDPAGPARTVAEAGYGWHRLEDSGMLVPVTPEQAAGVALENWVALPR